MSAQQAPEDQRHNYFELAIALSLALWPALTLAVQNNWGGADSADKRDWLGGEILNLFDSDGETNGYDVECMLLQVMQDEFEVVIDDESAFDTADQIMKLKAQCLLGNFTEVLKLKERWEKKGANNASVASAFQMVDNGENDQDTDGSDSEDGGMDIDMTDAPAPRVKEKVEPEIDKDGFQTVVSKKKR